MSAASIGLSLNTHKFYRALLWSGFLAGILDLTAALATNAWRGLSPTRVLQAISSGLLGMSAYGGGHSTAALGVMLHFLIAFTVAAIYCAASRKLRFLVRQPILWGVLYGVVVYFVMNLIVLPLSAFPHNISLSLVTVVTGLVIHMLFVGLPISLTARRYLK